VRAGLRQHFELQLPDRFLLIEPGEELRRILALELQQALKLPVQSCGLNDPKLSKKLESAVPVALAGKEKTVRQELAEGAELLILQARSVPASLAEWLPAPPKVLLGIASRWPGFLKLARTILLAAGFDPDSLIFRDARKSNWRRGLKEAKAVICDLATASDLPKTFLIVPFPLVSESSLDELRRYEQFIEGPLISSPK
jgi:hypothetical protein